MNLFQILQVLDAGLLPEDCKIHLACWNGVDDPLHAYFQGEFDDWQAWQRHRNFQRPRVISLISLPAPDRWLFAGVHDSKGCEWMESKELYRYEMERLPATDELDGRLVVDFRRPGRQSYLLAEKWVDLLTVSEVRPQRMVFQEFPGYHRVILPMEILELVVTRDIESWKGALKSVGGVYLIADRATGKLYVGSAVGEGGIWARWCSYAEDGHGGNTELKALLEANEPDYSKNLQFGILEIADTNSSIEEILERESRWKELLLTRKFGLNAN